MKVTQVAIRPTEISTKQGRPALTPELLAASGARYSRNNEGLEAILSKIDPDDLDKSVDSIFRMLDYGHQSIADMAPVAMFVDGVSIWMAYLVWSLVPTASGQESSTRYIMLSDSSVIDPSLVSQDPAVLAAWQGLIEQSFASYAEALKLWEGIAEAHPDAVRLPQSLLVDQSSKGKRQVDRMRRNYAFDRARYFLPAAAKTNVMLVMSARAWAQLIQQLLSHPLPEAGTLGDLLVEELALAAPRLLKYAAASDPIREGWEYEHNRLYKQANQLLQAIERNEYAFLEAEPEASLELLEAPEAGPDDIRSSLLHHANRYSWVGWDLCRTAVRFSWRAVAFAEIRDLNRHRTGFKYCPAIPQGFYYASDQLQALPTSTQTSMQPRLFALAQAARDCCFRGLRDAADGNPAYVYSLPLGAQFPFEHTTTADKFIYEAELRTGLGAHFRYASHLRDSLALWYEHYPGTRGLIKEGSAEPE